MSMVRPRPNAACTSQAEARSCAAPPRANVTHHNADTHAGLRHKAGSTDRTQDKARRSTAMRRFAAS
eukprot:6187324-Pleurochrysis_carterae.AAC.2